MRLQCIYKEAFRGWHIINNNTNNNMRLITRHNMSMKTHYKIWRNWITGVGISEILTYLHCRETFRVNYWNPDLKCIHHAIMRLQCIYRKLSEDGISEILTYLHTSAEKLGGIITIEIYFTNLSCHQVRWIHPHLDRRDHQERLVDRASRVFRQFLRLFQADLWGLADQDPLRIINF